MILFNRDSGYATLARMTTENEKENRFLEIDYLRGFAVIAMILIHTSVFYVSNPFAYFFWNYSQWAVPVFIYCSGYLYFKNYDLRIMPSSRAQAEGNYGYSKKRIIRLLVPYYMFLPFFFLALFIIHPKILTTNYILQSIFLTGGIQINWMVLLFLQFTFLMPILIWIYNKYRIFFWIYSLISVGSCILFLFWKPLFDWRLIMWLPWSIVLLFSFFYIKKRKKNFVFMIFILSLIIYPLSLFTVRYLGHSVNFYDNKYPPNMLIISFGVLIISGFYILKDKGVKWYKNDKWHLPLLFLLSPLSHLLLFLSRYSYSIYFIHYVILLLFTKWIDKFKNMWFMLFLLVFITTILIQKVINISINFIKFRKF